MSKKRKRRKVPKDKSGLPKKYLSGLSGNKRSARASLIKAMAEAYKRGQRIPKSMFQARYK